MVGRMTTGRVTTTYERWLLPERPGLRQLGIGIVALLLPLGCLLDGDGTNVYALVLSITVGCGLGIAWAWLCGWQWLRVAPVSAVFVFATCFASLANIELMPRWDVLVRAHRAMSDLQFYVHARLEGRDAELRSYNTGPGRALFVAVSDPASGRLRYVCTGEPIQRWTPVGYRPSCYVLVRADGSGQVLKNASEFAAARAAIGAETAPPVAPPPTPPATRQ